MYVYAALWLLKESAVLISAVQLQQDGGLITAHAARPLQLTAHQEQPLSTSCFVETALVSSRIVDVSLLLVNRGDVGA